MVRGLVAESEEVEGATISLDEGRLRAGLGRARVTLDQAVEVVRASDRLLVARAVANALDSAVLTLRAVDVAVTVRLGVASDQ